MNFHYPICEKYLTTVKDFWYSQHKLIEFKKCIRVIECKRKYHTA